MLLVGVSSEYEGAQDVNEVDDGAGGLGAGPLVEDEPAVDAAEGHEVGELVPQQVDTLGRGVQVPLPEARVETPDLGQGPVGQVVEELVQGAAHVQQEVHLGGGLVFQQVVSLQGY